MVVYHLHLHKLVDHSGMRLPLDKVCCGSGELKDLLLEFTADLPRREFTMAEIEHYVDPLDKQHARFNEVKDVKLALLPKDVQQNGKTDLTDMTVGDAVGQVS